MGTKNEKVYTEPEIKLDRGNFRPLLKLGSYPTIRKALRGYVGSRRSMQIRQEAIELGGYFEQKIQYKIQRVVYEDKIQPILEASADRPS